MSKEEEIQRMEYLALCIICLALGAMATIQGRYCLAIACLLFSNAGIYTFILANSRLYSKQFSSHNLYKTN